MKTKNCSLYDFFGTIPDHRIDRNKKHLLSDVLILSVLAVISGAESWDAIAMYGREKEAFLRTILSLPNGIPSHDTINRVFCTVCPELFEQSFVKWVESIKNPEIKKEVISIDGKCIKGSKDGYHNKSAIYMVSAFASENRLVLGQVMVNEKSNEITAIPELLNLINIKDSIITIDAIGTQSAISQNIVKGKADYILSVKGNQPTLNANVIESFIRLPADSISEHTDKGHGRIEVRKCEVIHNLKWIEEPDKWAGLNSLIKITATRMIKEKTEIETRYYISSLRDIAADMNKHIRAHWSIENTLHWSLDMVFDEDSQRKREKFAAQNFSFVRKIAFNLFKKDTSKGSMVSKRLKAGWSNEYLLKLINI